MCKKVAFLGLGVMGLSMARNLLKADFALKVWNRNAEKTRLLEREGAEAASTPAEAASGTDAVFICVTNGEALREVLFGLNGVVNASPLPQVIVDHSTVSPLDAKNVAARLDDLGIAFLDAPVTGGDVGARNGTLTIMVGGDEAQLNFAAPALEAMGKKIFHLGPCGSGQLAKCANQIAVAGAIAGMSEALHFASLSGLPIESVLSVLQGGAAGSWALENYAPRILKGDYAPGFLIEHMRKDLRISLQEGQLLGANLPLTQLAEKMYDELCDLVEAGTVGNHGLTLWYNRAVLKT